jgi:hypothetical protein
VSGVYSRVDIVAIDLNFLRRCADSEDRDDKESRQESFEH